MRRTILRAVISATIGLSAAGCMSQPEARYVYQDGEFGVIGIPRNSPFGKKNYLKQAQDLMERHFPSGYEIVRAEEVVEGERVLDQGRKTEIVTEPTLKGLDQMIRLGKLDRVTSLQQKDQIPILESRIIYKRKTPNTKAGANGFSALASITPKYYIDPNDAARCHTKELLAEAKNGQGGAKKEDATLKQAAHEPSK